LASITTLPCTHNSDIHTALNGADISSTVITEVQFMMKTTLVFYSQDLCEFEKDIVVKVSRPCIKCSPVRCQGLKTHYTSLIWLNTSYFLWKGDRFLFEICFEWSQLLREFKFW
jgi:hypothetical protein